MPCSVSRLRQLWQPQHGSDTLKDYSVDRLHHINLCQLLLLLLPALLLLLLPTVRWRLQPQ